MSNLMRGTGKVNFKKLLLQKHEILISTLGSSELDEYKQKVSMSVLPSDIRSKLYEMAEERENMLANDAGSLAISSEICEGDFTGGEL